MRELDTRKRTGVLIFTKSENIFAKIIRFIEGPQCSHMAGIYFDTFKNDYCVAEMKFGGWWFWRKGGLVSTEVEKWFKKNGENVVAVAYPTGNTREISHRLNVVISADVREGKGYDIGGLFGFLHQKFRKLNDPELYFCSEYWATRLKEQGLDIARKSKEALESPQDLMKLIGGITLEEVAINPYLRYKVT